jgi:hypothetical protein
MHTCYYCGPTDLELRPYGPGGATVCYPCATATPERERAARGAFGALLEMTSTVGLTGIGTEDGPINIYARKAGGHYENGRSG